MRREAWAAAAMTRVVKRVRAGPRMSFLAPQTQIAATTVSEASRTGAAMAPMLSWYSPSSIA
jgi:hypothetical protein